MHLNSVFGLLACIDSVGVISLQAAGVIPLSFGIMLVHFGSSIVVSGFATAMFLPKDFSLAAALCPGFVSTKSPPSLAAQRGGAKGAGKDAQVSNN